MPLRYEEIAELIKIIDASACDELVLETPELKLILRRHGPGSPAPPASRDAAPSADPAAPARIALAIQPAQSAPRHEQRTSPAGIEVRSPMVGTFYRAPSPDAAPFVSLGTEIASGQPLCVIEVMKLFTTIFAEASGRIAEIGAEDGELVEYGRVLFVIADTT